MAEEYGKNNSIHVMETSAKNNNNVDNLFVNLVDAMMVKRQENTLSSNQQTNIINANVMQFNGPKKKSCCK